MTSAVLCAELMTRAGAAEVMLVTFAGGTLVHRLARGEAPGFFNPWATASRLPTDDAPVDAWTGVLHAEYARVGECAMLMVRVADSGLRPVLQRLMAEFAARLHRALEALQAPTAHGGGPRGGTPAHDYVVVPFPSDRRRLN